MKNLYTYNLFVEDIADAYLVLLIMKISDCKNINKF